MLVGSEPPTSAEDGLWELGSAASGSPAPGQLHLGWRAAREETNEEGQPRRAVCGGGGSGGTGKLPGGSEGRRDGEAVEGGSQDQDRGMAGGSRPPHSSRDFFFVPLVIEE